METKENKETIKKNLNNIDDLEHIFYINLEHRIDRKKSIENELNKLGLLQKANRFNAIKMSNGAIGCSLSHYQLLRNALKNNLNHICILEDDIIFLNPELFISQLNKFLENHKEWDVILIAGNNLPPYQKIDDTCIKVNSCQTTTGYIVNGHYISKLITNIKVGLTNLINKPHLHSLYAIDKFWFLLQKVDNWFLIIPTSVVQKEDYSDIEKRNVNYKNIMLDINKNYLFYKK